MRILLTEAPFDYPAEFAGLVKRYFPLGIGYIAAYLRRHGHDVAIFSGGMGEEFRTALEAAQPDWVGFSAMTSSFPNAVRMAQTVKECSNAKTIIGGQHVSSVGPETLQQFPCFDFMVIGEGEETALELTKKFETKDTNYSDILGIAYRTPLQIVKTPPRGLLQDLDSYPAPARDLVDLSLFGTHNYLQFGKRLTASLVTTRGCPWHCTYCSSHVTMGRKYREHSAEYVGEDIERMVKDFGITNFIFWDDVFTASRKRIHTVCEEFIKRGLGDKITWWCLSRVDRLDEDSAKAMKRAGCQMISFGVESGNQETLDRMKKLASLDGAIEAVALCKKVGIRTQATFILGFPWETPRMMQDTIDFAKRLSPQIAIFFPLTPYPGTDLWDIVTEEVKPKSVEEWSKFVMTTLNPRSYVKGITTPELKKTIRRAHMEFYLRPSQIWNMTRRMESFYEFFSYAKSAISLTYQTGKDLVASREVGRASVS